jgi:hypothetical protein
VVTARNLNVPEGAVAGIEIGIMEEPVNDELLPPTVSVLWKVPSELKSIQNWAFWQYDALVAMLML